MSKVGERRIAVVGAGIAGLTCAKMLKGHFDVEVFESAQKNSASRPQQMEGGVHYCGFVPELEPTHPIKELLFSSENRSVMWKGNIGYTYMIGGTEGIDARLRQRLEKEVNIHYARKIGSLNELSDFDIIVAADGFRSKIAMLAGMRKKSPRMWGVGIGSTIKGEFKIGRMECTFNTDVAPGGYRYLIPISEDRATLASACIARKLDTKRVRTGLRRFALARGFKILNEWTDFEKWYDIDTYHKDNIYLIGGAASFTDQCFGFGLKYGIQSAKLCAKAIAEGSDYNAHLRPILKELRYWEKISGWFIDATNRDYDRMMRLSNLSFIKNRAQKGRSIRAFYRLLRLF